MLEIGRDFARSLKPGGKLVLYEATVKVASAVETWIRRTEQSYERLMRQAGFRLLERDLIAFPLSEVLEKKWIAPLRRYFFADGLEAYANGLFRMLCRVAFWISSRLDRFFASNEGRTFFVFEAASGRHGS